MATKIDEIDDDYVLLGREPSPDDNDEDEDKQRKVDSLSQQRLRILVLGKNGSGKTTLIKSFLGSDDTTITDDLLDSEQMKLLDDGNNHCRSKVVDIYSTNMCGVVLEFYDTKGLGDPNCNDKKLLQDINTEFHEGFNLVLVCMRMDEEIDKTLVNALLEISNVYGEALWERAVFVLTFANVYAERSNQNTAETMTQHVEEFVDLLRKQLVKDPRWLYSVKDSVYKNIPFCMAGIIRKENSKDHMLLPTTQDWLQDLFVACMGQSTNEPVAASKLNQDKKRLLMEAGTVGSSAVIGGAAGAFVGGAIGTVIFPGVGTVVGAGIGSLIGGGIGTATIGGTVVGMRISDRKAETNNTTTSNEQINNPANRLLDRSKQVFAQVKNKFKKTT